MMNLKDGRGKIPIRNSTQHEATPYLLIDFPDRSEFDLIYSKHKSQDLRDKYWQVLKHRSQGQTLADAGKPFGITRERVRQIEARFQRLVGERYSTQLEANLSKLYELQHLVESFSNSAMLEMFPLADDNR
jgi:hypothetical protein